MGIETAKIRRLGWGKEARTGFTNERSKSGKLTVLFDLVMVTLG